jgi:hypothetical protein
VVDRRQRLASILGEEPSELRPRWRVELPTGQQLALEYDRLRRLWRVTPGEYVRRRLGDALAQASGEERDAPWIVALEEELPGAN